MPRTYREFVTIQVHQAMSRNDDVDFFVIQAVSVASDISGRGDDNEVNEVAVDSIRSLKRSTSMDGGGAAMSNLRFKRKTLEEVVSLCDLGHWLLQAVESLACFSRRLSVGTLAEGL
jgi:hypothetical protein